MWATHSLRLPHNSVETSPPSLLQMCHLFVAVPVSRSILFLRCMSGVAVIDSVSLLGTFLLCCTQIWLIDWFYSEL